MADGDEGRVDAGSDLKKRGDLVGIGAAKRLVVYMYLLGFRKSLW